MKRFLLYTFYPLLRDLLSLLVYPLCRVLRLNRNRVIVFLYHSVSPDDPEKAADYMNVKPGRFTAQLRAVADGPWRALDEPDFLSFLRGEIEFPAGGVFITFDDGFKSFYEHAYPALRRLSLPSVLFVTAGYVGSNGPFPWLESLSFGSAKDYPESWFPVGREELSSITDTVIGVHGYSHKPIGRMEPSDARDELQKSKDVIEKITGRPAVLFAYPHGIAEDGDWDEDTNRLVREAGFAAAFNSHFGRVRPGDDAYALKRTPVSANDTPSRIKRKLYGAYDWTYWVQRAYHRLKRKRV